MATSLGIDMNATGYGPQDLRSSEGGNNSRGMLDQTRPTGIMATGGGSSKRKEGRAAKRMMGRAGRKR